MTIIFDEGNKLHKMSLFYCLLALKGHKGEFGMRGEPGMIGPMGRQGEVGQPV